MCFKFLIRLIFGLLCAGVEQVFTDVAKQIRRKRELQQETRRQHEQQEQLRQQAAKTLQPNKDKRSSYVLMNEDGTFQASKSSDSSSCCGL